MTLSEWLEEDIANLTSDEEDTDAPGQHLESTPTEEHYQHFLLRLKQNQKRNLK